MADIHISPPLGSEQALSMRSGPRATRDVTPRRRSGAAARRAPAESGRQAAVRWRAVVATAIDGIITIDEDGIIETVNASALKLFGYEPSELIGKNVKLLMPESYHSAHDRTIARYLSTGRRRIIGGGREVVGCRKDGSIFPMELAISETPFGRRRIFTGILRDISERKRTEQALQAAVQERTAELAKANQLLRVEMEQRRHAEAALAGKRRVLALIASGASADDALVAIHRTLAERSGGVRCSIRVSAEDAPTATRVFGHPSLLGLPAGFPADGHARCVVEDAGAEPLLRAWAKRSGVRALWLEPVVGSTGQVLGRVVLAYTESRRPNDIELEAATTAARLAGIIIEKAQTDERARKQLADLAHVARLATMGEMASGLAHELNQPLCAIVNYAEACLSLLEAKANPVELRHAMTEVARQSERAGEVIRRLREFVRHREPQRAAVDVNQTVREVMGLTRTDLQQHEVNVKLQLGLRLPPVLADAIQIQQVLVNLVRNALDAMSGTESARRRLKIKTCRKGEFVEVAVEDAGRGIDTAAQDQIFESFFTTKQHGMGMGLSISRSIVEMHDGRIWVTPNPKRGVTFHFTLPRVRRKRDGGTERDRVRGG